MNAPAARPKRLGDILIEQGLISKDQLRIALTEQKRTNEALGKLFVSLGFVSDSVIRDLLGAASGQHSVDISSIVVDAEAIKLISKATAQRFGVVPITFDRVNSELTIAMADIFDVVALDKIKATLGAGIEIKPMHTGEEQIADAIDKFYGFELSVEGILQELETGTIDVTAATQAGDAFSQPLVRLVDALLMDAVKRGASDIHFEPEKRFLRIRYRIDGILRQVRILHINYWAGMAVRLKVMANMNIAESRAPQDGRISLSLSGHAIDFRVAAHPTIHGENIVLRILDRKRGIVPLEQLDLQEDALDTLKLMMARPEGIILVTGPTGSGKTTTLYSLLNHINTEEVNIMTLEDPVEYPMSLIRQTSIGDAVKLDFASGVRSMMRQDPDIVLVGEIRDEPTAEMAFRAAMTGHQVYSTLHTNSAFGAIPRLLDIGIKPHILAGNIIGIVAQRLLRKLCADCKVDYQAAPVELRLLATDDTELPPDTRLYRAVGCPRCEFTGYRGRLALMEVLKINDEMDELIAERASLGAVRKSAKESGFKTLADNGARRILQGLTSLDEVARVVDLTARLK